MFGVAHESSVSSVCGKAHPLTIYLFKFDSQGERGSRLTTSFPSPCHPTGSQIISLLDTSRDPGLSFDPARQVRIATRCPVAGSTLVEFKLTHQPLEFCRHAG